VRPRIERYPLPLGLSLALALASLAAVPLLRRA